MRVQNKFKLFGLALVFAVGLSASDEGGGESAVIEFCRVFKIGERCMYGKPKTIKINPTDNKRDISNQVKALFDGDYKMGFPGFFSDGVSRDGEMPDNFKLGSLILHLRNTQPGFKVLLWKKAE